MVVNLDRDGDGDVLDLKSPERAWVNAHDVDM